MVRLSIVKGILDTDDIVVNVPGISALSFLNIHRRRTHARLLQHGRVMFTTRSTFHYKSLLSTALKLAISTSVAAQATMILLKLRQAKSRR
jgi:hypothetical protein